MSNFTFVAFCLDQVSNVGIGLGLETKTETNPNSNPNPHQQPKVFLLIKEYQYHFSELLYSTT